MNGLLLGAIADDYTGGSDMAGMLAGEGVRTVQTFGIPAPGDLDTARDAQAVVVSLKTRSIRTEDAVAQSLAALERLASLEPRQVQFKYCSTFDSTDAGNIGPVTDALMGRMGCGFTIAVPALPVNGRTQYLGYLFVNGVLLSESPMRSHPLNPMTEPNLVRHLQRQTDRRCGLVDLQALRNATPQPPGGVEIALVDAIDDSDLQRIAATFAGLPLITGGSGISRALAQQWTGVNSTQVAPRAAIRGHDGPALMLAGSCSAATLQQIAAWKESGGAAERMRTESLDSCEVARLADWCSANLRSRRSALVYSSAPADERAGSPEAIERAFGQLATALLGSYGRLIVAGGETSGSVVEALGIRAVEIGAAIDPGVPALRTVSGPPLALTLKSGNFGCRDFFEKAMARLSD